MEKRGISDGPSQASKASKEPAQSDNNDHQEESEGANLDTFGPSGSLDEIYDEEALIVPAERYAVLMASHAALQQLKQDLALQSLISNADQEDATGSGEALNPGQDHLNVSAEQLEHPVAVTEVQSVTHDNDSQSLIPGGDQQRAQEKTLDPSQDKLTVSAAQVATAVPTVTEAEQLIHRSHSQSMIPEGDHGERLDETLDPSNKRNVTVSKERFETLPAAFEDFQKSKKALQKLILDTLQKDTRLLATINPVVEAALEELKKLEDVHNDLDLENDKTHAQVPPVVHIPRASFDNIEAGFKETKSRLLNTGMRCLVLEEACQEQNATIQSQKEKFDAQVKVVGRLHGELQTAKFQLATEVGKHEDILKSHETTIEIQTTEMERLKKEAIREGDEFRPLWREFWKRGDAVKSLEQKFAASTKETERLGQLLKDAGVENSGSHNVLGFANANEYSDDSDDDEPPRNTHSKRRVSEPAQCGDEEDRVSYYSPSRSISPGPNFPQTTPPGPASPLSEHEYGTEPTEQLADRGRHTARARKRAAGAAFERGSKTLSDMEDAGDDDYQPTPKRLRPRRQTRQGPTRGGLRRTSTVKYQEVSESEDSADDLW